MSLVHAANHLAAQGRGGDTHLVHMTSKELAAMQKLAESQGKSLTINPKTGLPEAGILSTILPMAIGALAVGTGNLELLPLIAGGVGVADYAITGSLTQGLMAGLGTWSGGNLASGLAEAGAASTANAAAQEGGNQATQEFAKQQAAAEATRLTAQETAQQTASELAKSQIGNMTNLTADQVTNMTANLTDANAAEIVKSAGMANAGMGLPAASTAANMGAGITSGSALGNTLMNNKMALAGVAAPLLMNSLTKQKTVAPLAAQQKNPFGMKEIPRDENGKPIFNATLPAQPNPAYTPVYPDYVKNPYVSGAADGGLMGGIPSYKGSPDYGSMVEGVGEVDRGIEMATKRRPLEVPNPYVEIEPDEPELRRLDPHNRARKMLEMLSSSSKVKMAKGLPQSNVLGAISTDPAQMIAEQRAKQAIAAEQAGQEAKEGGLMASGDMAHYGLGGKTTQTQTADPNRPLDRSQPYDGMYTGVSEALSKIFAQQDQQAPPTNTFASPSPQSNMQGSMQGYVYQPQYTDYTANPYNPMAAQQHAAPTANPMLMSGGYKIDPSLMRSNAQIVADIEARRLAELQPEPRGFVERAVRDVGAKAGGLMAAGGPANLGDYSDGGRLLRGPGDGVSDSIPATIGGKQPARLATGEFVIPARIVSELGNGSTDAGAKRLYAMMDRIKAKRSKTKNIAADTKAYKYLPA